MVKRDRRCAYGPGHSASSGVPVRAISFCNACLPAPTGIELGEPRHYSVNLPEESRRSCCPLGTGGSRNAARRLPEQAERATAGMEPRPLRLGLRAARGAKVTSG
jgi:hypothetical protein